MFVSTAGLSRQSFFDPRNQWYQNKSKQKGDGIQEKGEREGKPRTCRNLKWRKEKNKSTETWMKLFLRMNWRETTTLLKDMAQCRRKDIYEFYKFIPRIYRYLSDQKHSWAPISYYVLDWFSSRFSTFTFRLGPQEDLESFFLPLKSFSSVLA